MGVDKFDYIMLAVDLPESIFSAEGFYEKYEDYIQGKESIMPFLLVYDGMNGKFARFGIVLASGNGQNGFGYNELVELSYTTQQEQEVANLSHTLFGVTLPVRLIAFSLWS